MAALGEKQVGDPTTNVARASAQIRVARPTNRLPELVSFYCEGLGLEVIDSFSGHRGFSGVMIGLPGTGLHLEFTSNQDQLDLQVGLAPTKDNLLVFYLAVSDGFASVSQRMDSLGYSNVDPVNPYWADADSLTYEDPDGWRVVLVPTAYA